MAEHLAVPEWDTLKQVQHGTCVAMSRYLTLNIQCSFLKPCSAVTSNYKAFPAESRKRELQNKHYETELVYYR